MTFGSRYANLKIKADYDLQQKKQLVTSRLNSTILNFSMALYQGEVNVEQYSCCLPQIGTRNYFVHRTIKVL